MSGTLSQSQIIRSLGQALEWYEKEVAWGVSPGELSHLTGRIGELYAAMITRGQMALATNQRGYDVVSADGEYISVKTITSSNHVKFRASTFDLVQRIMILRLIIDDDTVSIEEITDCPAEDIRNLGASKEGTFIVPIKKQLSDDLQNSRQTLSVDKIQRLKETASASYETYRIIQYENGTILVEDDGKAQAVTKPILRQIAAKIGVSTLNGSGNYMNTRSLGSQIILALS